MKKHLLALALISGAFVSCTDDSYDLDNISNDFRIGVNEYLPIAHSSVKLKDMLDEFKSDYIEEDKDNNLFFVFDTTTIVDIKPFEITIEPTSYDFESEVTIIDGVIPSQSSYSFEIPINLGFDNEDGEGRIDSINVKECKLGFYIDGDNINTGDLSLRIETSYFQFKTSTTTDPGYNSIVIKDNWIKFDENGDLFVTCTVTAEKDIPVSGTNFKLSVVTDKAQLTYNSIWGSLKSNVAQNDYTDFYINLYDDNLDFDLEVKDPKLTISAKTNCGMPLACTVKEFVGKHKSKKSTAQDSVKAKFRSGQDTLDIKDVDYAKTPGEIVPAFREEFDNVNGSLGEIFSYLPDSVKVKSSFRVNSNVDDDQSYFLLESTYLEVNINARIPLHIGQKSYLTINDTIDGIDIEKEIEDYKKSDFGVEKAEVILQLENKLPLEAIVDIKFCDVDTVAGVPHFYEFKSIHQSVKVNSASVIDKRSGSSIPTKKTIKVDDTMLEDIKHIKAICFKYTIKVPTGVDENGILLTSDCGLSASAYAHVKANITNSEDK